MIPVESWRGWAPAAFATSQKVAALGGSVVCAFGTAMFRAARDRHPDIDKSDIRVPSLGARPQRHFGRVATIAYAVEWGLLFAIIPSVVALGVHAASGASTLFVGAEPTLWLA